MDEAITVGISSHHLSAIPGILRQDGSPPLFYLLLHFWMPMVGNGEAATHWLSEIFAVLTIPVGYWGGLKIAGKRAALMTATLMASSAFLDYYSQETRMYALMTLLGLLGTIGFIRGFVFRERRYVILFSLSPGGDALHPQLGALLRRRVGRCRWSSCTTSAARRSART